MRLIRVLVPDDRLESVADVLDEEDISYVRQRAWFDGTEQWMIECPVPTDAIGHVLERLESSGVETDEYTVVTSLTSAMHPQVESLNDRFATGFEPLTRDELRTKAMDISQDARSFFALTLASAVIATAGLLLDSPAIIVGSMVIAPIVGPVLTASVGAILGDREMLVDSVEHQVLGMVAAVLGAAVFSYGLQVTGFVPGTLAVGSIELIAVRGAPSMLVVTVGLAAGMAGAFGLATKGPTSLIGVMIAAALIPAAATSGIAAAWGEIRIAVGSLLLIALTLVLINAATYGTLWLFKYRPQRGEERRSLSANTRARSVLAVGAILALALLIAVTGVLSAQQIGFERTVNEQVESTLQTAEHSSLEPVAVRIQYAGAVPFASPESVTVTASRNGTRRPSQVADDLQRRISEATGHDVKVRVRFLSYQRANESGRSAAVKSPRIHGVSVSSSGSWM